MVGFVSRDGAVNGLILPIVYWLVITRIFVLKAEVTLDKFNADVVLTCEGVQTWINPHGHVIEADGTKYKSDGDNLTIAKVGEKDLGPYTCVKARNITVELRSRPFIKPLERSYNLIQGGSIEVNCYVIAYPPATVTWSRSGMLVSNNSTLTILDAKSEDYGIYACEAENFHGNASSLTKIRVKAKLAPLWPFIGIIAEVVILVVIIIIYERKKSKRDAEEILKDNGQKPGENNSANLRQRK